MLRALPLALLIVVSSSVWSVAWAADPATQPMGPKTATAPAKPIEPTTRAADPARDPLAFVPGSWTLAVIPDVQNYNDNAAGPKYQRELDMIRWVAAHKKARNIQFVVTTGDLTNQNTRAQWTNVRRALAPLDGELPYAVVTGNHDYSAAAAGQNSDTRLNDHFKAEQNPLNDPAKGGTLEKTYEKGRLENASYLLKVNNQTYLFVILEWGPRDAVVEWANNTVKAHPEARVILMTHAYLYFDDTRYHWSEKAKKQSWNPHSYSTTREGDKSTNDGEELWQKLAKKQANMSLVISGHVLGDEVGYLSSKGDTGNTIHQMLYNRQNEDDGQLRLLEFLPDNRTVHVKTYSPITANWATDDANQFILDLAPASTDAPASRPAK